jgi:hypothetical protein
VKLRAPTVEDLPAPTRFFATLNEIYGTGGETEAELEAWLESPIFDPAADFRVAMAENGLVGWCGVWDQNRKRSRFFADVRAHPRTATVYAALLDWADGRARAAAEPPAFLRVWCDAMDEVCAGEVRRKGFRLNRHFVTMEIDLDEEPAPPEWLEGISVRTFRPEDAHAVHEALHSFRELRRHGRRKADLGVDAENTTGAVRLYERTGMHVARQSDSYEPELV